MMEHLPMEVVNELSASGIKFEINDGKVIRIIDESTDALLWEKE